MRITLIRGSSRNRMAFLRRDGSTELADLGPQLPGHDLAHYVVERHLGMQRGFYGHLGMGFTVGQLSDKHVIRSLPPESMAAEILARALQSLAGGACTEEQFAELAGQELAVHAPDYSVVLQEGQIRAMLGAYRQLLDRWEALAEGGQLILEWEPG
ncbi:MAG: hypothetical protein NW241_15345 [Bacteroidia bacterium]|nr:hypothetical protein [Bacteroidia bacterium]